MNVTANATTSATDHGYQEEDTVQLLDRMQDFDELLVELLEESEKAFQEGRLGFCAFIDTVVIPGVAAQSDQARDALQQAYSEN